MKMGATRSPCPYDAAARHALQKIQNNPHAAHMGRNLLQHLQDLATHGELAQREPSDVATRSRQASDEPAAERIVNIREDDRNDAGRPRYRQQWQWAGAQ